MKILVCDPISPRGVELLRRREEFEVVVLPKPPTEAELLPLAADAAAIVVRSETKVTRPVLERAGALRVVGRAGVGVDNIDVDAATSRGVVVMNTPGGNTVSTAELTFSMMMALARHIPQANQSMKEGRWDRKKYRGVELFGKTLGILGMGRIGSEVARRAVVFGMRVLAYDPYLSAARAKALGVEVVEHLENLYPEVDFLTVHMPMSDETRGMINTAALAQMKDGVRLINCARGGIIAEADLADAIRSGKVAGAALDVYETEPPPADFALREMPQIVMTPHLGASTDEAQDNVGIEVAEAISDFLLTGAVRNAVNMPNLDARTYERVRPYLLLGESLGRVLAQLAPNRNDRLIIKLGGTATEIPGDPITRFVLKGFLGAPGGEDVNLVNVRVLAESLGLQVDVVKSDERTDFSEWIHVAAESEGRRHSVGGTFYHTTPRIVRLDSHPVEIVPDGVLFLMNNRDRPGIVGQVGTLFGRHNVNIANMSLSRTQVGGQALTVLNLDSVPPAELIEELERDPDITNVRVVKL